MIDYSKLPISKGTPRVVDRIAKKRALEATTRACRIAVRKRDKGKCVIPGCRDRATALHHIQYRSQGGKWQTGNICSLCRDHHELVHAAIITIEGDADVHLTIHGSKERMKFVL